MFLDREEFLFSFLLISFIHKKEKKMKQCCGCISLRTGTLTLAIIGLAFGIVLFGIFCASLPSDNELGTINGILVAIMVIFGSICGIFGVIHSNANLVSVFFYTTVLRFIGTIRDTADIFLEAATFDSYTFCRSQDGVHDRETLEDCMRAIKVTFFFIEVLAIAALFLHGYFLFVIWAYHRELKEGREVAALADAEQGTNDGRSGYGTM